MKKHANIILMLVMIALWTFTLVISVLNFRQVNELKKGDLNRDGVVNALDLSILMSNWSSK